MIVLQPGPDGMLEQREVPDPVPGFGDVVVRVEAAGVNKPTCLCELYFLVLNRAFPGMMSQAQSRPSVPAFRICRSAPGLY